MAKREVGLVRLKDPEFLTLTDKPANRTGFKVIRHEEDNMAHKDRNRVLRTRREVARSDNNLLSITFPHGIDQDEAEEIIDAFNLGDNYELAQTDDGTYYARRAGEEGPGEGVTIEIGSGYAACIAEPALAARSDSGIIGVTLIGLEFDETHDAEAVKNWLEERGIEYPAGGVNTFEGGTEVMRHESPEGVEVRKVKLGDGISGLVARTKDDDVPVKVYRSVMEQSYGNWGWGHINFATAMADPAFTDQSWDAIYILRDIMENIILYSGLPLDERKTLVQNACDQFTQYISNLIDTLPRGVIEQARSDRRKPKQETTEMPKAKDKDTEVSQAKDTNDEGTATRSDEESTATAVETKEKEEYVTRSELKDVVTEAVSEAMKVHTEQTPKAEGTQTQRSDDNDGEPGDEILAMLKRMDTKIDDIQSSHNDLKKEVDDLGGTTVARSDDDDDETDTFEGEKAQRGEHATPFTGMFGDRFN